MCGFQFRLGRLNGIMVMDFSTPCPRGSLSCLRPLVLTTQLAMWVSEDRKSLHGDRAVPTQHAED